jgi:hypothetical protein
MTEFLKKERGSGPSKINCVGSLVQRLGNRPEDFNIIVEKFVEKPGLSLVTFC